MIGWHAACVYGVKSSKELEGPMEAIITRTPLGGVLDRTELESVLAGLSRRAPDALVRWDGTSMSVADARDALEHCSFGDVVALMLMDGSRLALSLSTRRPSPGRGAA